MEYSSAGVGTTGLVTGIIGTALGVANSGGMGGVFGWNGRNAGYGSDCYADKMAYLNSEIAMLKADRETDKKIIEAYTVLNRIDNETKAELRNIAVYQAHNDERMHCLSERVRKLEDMTQLMIPSKNIYTPTT